MTRRQLLHAGAAAGALALSADPLVSRALAKASPPPPGELKEIEHVIVLIQENRSFDHYFGTMAGVRGYGDSEALPNVFRQQGYPESGFGGELLPFHLGSTECFPDLTHSWQPQHQSWDSGAMDEFVKAHVAFDPKASWPETMGYYERADIPFYYALAEAYTLCDAYHCSVLGPTYPNRLYSMSGTLDPNGLNGGPLVETTHNIEAIEGLFKWETMPEALSTAGVTWKSYQGTGLGLEDNLLEAFANFKTNKTLAEKGLAPKYPADFKYDLTHNASHGTFPQVSWINTSLGETEHPGSSSAAIGENVVASLLKLLWAHPAIWKKTALFITWDENGGFFDHVPPPVAPEGTKEEFLTVPDITNNDGGIAGPIGLGFRVPMMIVSPFSRGGFLSSEVFDHTSILQFIEKRFGVEVPNLSAWRRETTGDLTKAFNFVAPNAKKVKLPAVGPPGTCAKNEEVTVPTNSMPVQEPGAGKWRKPSG